MENIKEIIKRMMTQSGGRNNQYPTKEEILEASQKHKVEVIKFVRRWKSSVWKMARDDDDRSRFVALQLLIEVIAERYYDKPVEVIYQPEARSCYYDPNKNRIAINKSLSIISALHELAHSLFGPSEKKACIWSVGLFRKTFKKAYEKLEWNGHMLVKQRSTHNKQKQRKTN